MTKTPNDIKEIEQRIARLKKNTTSEKKEKDAVHSGIFQGLQLAVEFVSGTIVGAGIGYILDELFDSEYIFLLIFVVLGCMAGILNAYRYAQRQDEK